MGSVGCPTNPPATPCNTLGKTVLPDVLAVLSVSSSVAQPSQLPWGDTASGCRVHRRQLVKADAGGRARHRNAAPSPPRVCRCNYGGRHRSGPHTQRRFARQRGLGPTPRHRNTAPSPAGSKGGITVSATVPATPPSNASPWQRRASGRTPCHRNGPPIGNGCNGGTAVQPAVFATASHRFLRVNAAHLVQAHSLAGETVRSSRPRHAGTRPPTGLGLESGFLSNRSGHQETGSCSLQYQFEGGEEDTGRRGCATSVPPRGRRFQAIRSTRQVSS
jgi:hypothetical protein